MGVCEGHPSSIMPDHLGRADYHGTSINQAARFMDAGEWGRGGGINLGRADYHGTSINQADRFMDAGEWIGSRRSPLTYLQGGAGRVSQLPAASSSYCLHLVPGTLATYRCPPSAAAAHGGQVACEEHLAVEVLEQWQQQLRQTQEAASLGAQLRPGDTAASAVAQCPSGEELQVSSGGGEQKEEGLAQPEVQKGPRCAAGGGLPLEGDDGTKATVDRVAILLAAPAGCTPASSSSIANAIRAPGSASVVETAAEDDSSFWRLPEGSVAEGGAVVEAVAHRLGMFRCALARLNPESGTHDLASCCSPFRLYSDLVIQDGMSCMHLTWDDADRKYGMGGDLLGGCYPLHSRERLSR